MLEWSPTALRDAKGLLADLPKPEADAFHEQLLRVTKSLARQDAVSGIVPELKELGLFGYREIPFDPFSLFFKLAGSRIQILAVLDRRQDLREVLFRRLMAAL